MINVNDVATVASNFYQAAIHDRIARKEPIDGKTRRSLLKAARDRAIGQLTADFTPTPTRLAELKSGVSRILGRHGGQTTARRYTQRAMVVDLPLWRAAAQS